MSETSDKLEELRQLNSKFYELFGELFENKELMPNKATYEYMAAKLFEQYKGEYEVLKVNSETIERPALYGALVRHNELVPRRRFLFFRNRAQKLIDAEAMAEIEKFFRESKEKIERLNELLDKSDDISKEPTAFEEPEAEQEESGKSEDMPGAEATGPDEVQVQEESNNPEEMTSVDGAQSGEDCAEVGAAATGPDEVQVHEESNNPEEMTSVDGAQSGEECAEVGAAM